MRLVVTDTGPTHYLMLIGRIDLLPSLFGTIAMPPAVHAELLHQGAPDAVRE